MNANLSAIWSILIPMFTIFIYPKQTIISKNKFLADLISYLLLLLVGYKNQSVIALYCIKLSELSVKELVIHPTLDFPPVPDYSGFFNELKECSQQFRNEIASVAYLQVKFSYSLASSTAICTYVCCSTYSF